MQNKKGQISETTTWVVATLIIVVILSISVFLASFVGSNKSFPTSSKIDLLAKKSLISYLLTENNLGVPVYEQITSEGSLNDFNGNLASEVFNEFYKEYNLYIFLGIRDYSMHTSYPNSYFSSPAVALGNAGLNSRNAVFYLINLNNDKLVHLLLWKSS